jgi:hypothetical protein
MAHAAADALCKRGAVHPFPGGVLVADFELHEHGVSLHPRNPVHVRTFYPGREAREAGEYLCVCECTGMEAQTNSLQGMTFSTPQQGELGSSAAWRPHNRPPRVRSPPHTPRAPGCVCMQASRR